MSEMVSVEFAETLADAVLRDCLVAFPNIRLTVTGSCMAPQLRPGDTVLVAATGRQPPRLGDVVLVRHAGGLRLHRLVWNLLPGSRWRTKGDRAAVWDPGIRVGDVLGTVIADSHGRRPTNVTRALRSLLGGFWAQVRARFPGASRAS
jgi:hypothetical protein